MSENKSILTGLLEDNELVSMFERVAQKNGHSAIEVLSTFIKDYIVSGGHPEQVRNSAVSKENER